MKLYWCNINNFGDELNKYIFEKCFNVKTEYASTWQADAIGIGSILDRCLLQIRDTIPFIQNKIFHNKKPLYILSSGFASPLEHYTKKPRFYKRALIKRPVETVSLRGFFSKKQLEPLILSGGGG